MRENTRERIIDAAAALMHSRGYQGTGLKDVLEASGVPKGSFYHHFKSKEELGLAVVDRQNARMAELLAEFAGPADDPPLTRLLRSFERFRDYYVARGYRLGCPIGNLAQEMGDLSEPFRVHLLASMEERTRWLVDLVAQGQAAGEMDPGLDGAEAAAFLLSAWQGALIRMKVSQSAAPLELFLRYAAILLARPGAAPDGRAAAQPETTARP